jgi:hypothetical protein
MLNILTPYGNHYKVDDSGNIIRIDINGFKSSGNWKFLGLSHVKRNEFIPFDRITTNILETLNVC